MIELILEGFAQGGLASIVIVAVLVILVLLLFTAIVRLGAALVRVGCLALILALFGYLAIKILGT